MTASKLPDRWDGCDDPDYQPTDDELNERITLDGIEDATPEDLARAIICPFQGSTL